MNTTRLPLPRGWLTIMPCFMKAPVATVPHLYGALLSPLEQLAIVWNLVTSILAKAAPSLPANFIKSPGNQGPVLCMKRSLWNPLAKFHYDSDGWGITNDGEFLIISDGSSSLQFINPLTFRKTREIKVRDGLREIDNINELEYVDGTLFANVYGSDSISLIEPADGRVIGNLDVSILRQQMIQEKNLPPEALGVLNGIAYNPADGHFFLTGKQWPYIIEGVISPKK